jgi:hypothetical protein
VGLHYTTEIICQTPWATLEIGGESDNILDCLVDLFPELTHSASLRVTYFTLLCRLGKVFFYQIFNYFSDNSSLSTKRQDVVLPQQ